MPLCGFSKRTKMTGYWKSKSLVAQSFGFHGILITELTGYLIAGFFLISDSHFLFTMLWMADGLRIHADKPHFLLLICSVVFTGAQHNNRLNYFDRVESYTNICPLGHHHKDNPSAEPGLVDFVRKSDRFSNQLTFLSVLVLRMVREFVLHSWPHAKVARRTCVQFRSFSL